MVVWHSGGTGAKGGWVRFVHSDDGGEGRGCGDAQLGLGLDRVAEEAIGLVGAELTEAAEEGTLGAGVVAGEALDGEFGVVGAEGIAVGGEGGFEAADALEVPGGEDEAVEQVLLEPEKKLLAFSY